jgi:hypothetical protein
MGETVLAVEHQYLERADWRGCSCGLSFHSFGEWARHVGKTEHAVSYDRTIDAEGKSEEREYHYLTCKTCKVEKDANDLAIAITKLLRPDEFGKWKWQVECILRKYLRG